MRLSYVSLSVFLLLASETSGTTAGLPLETLPAREAATVSQVRLAAPMLRIPLDTVPPLTRAEERELRRLEREVARMRRRNREAPRYPDSRYVESGDRPNGLAIAALPAGVAGVILFLVAVNAWNPGPLLVLSAGAFVCALVFGAAGLRRAKREGRRHRGLAIAGMVLGIIGAAFYSVVLVSWLSWAL